MDTLTEPRPVATPDDLLYEQLNGRALYRRGFRDVLAHKKTVEEIMGSSSLQAFVISILFTEITRHLPDDYLAFTSESGLHLGHGDNLANDIAIFLLADIKKVDETYFSIPPKIVIEVDVKINLDDQGFMSPTDYVNIKTQKMLDFGVERVIWITTAYAARKVMVAEPNNDWILTNWDSEIDVAPGCRLSLETLIEKRGLGYLL